MRERRPPWARRAAAIAMVAAIVAAFTLAVMQFGGAFQSTTSVSLYAARAGLVMSPQAKVRLRGLVVGHVASITTDAGRVRLTLDIDDDELSRIPADVGAQIRSNTVFGAKSVDLQAPEDPSARHLVGGDVISAERVEVELNTVFARLVSVLAAVQPEKLNATIGALDTALNGRGDRIGAGLANLSTVVGRIDQILPQVNSTISQTGRASDLYADVFGDLSRTLDNTTVTGSTLADKATDLDALLVDTTGVARTINSIIEPKKDVVSGALSDLDPVARLLGYQSPGIACFLVTADKALQKALPLFGDQTGLLALDASVVPGKEPYRYPQNLPRNNANGPPTCAYGLSDIDSTAHVPFYVGDTAAQPFQPRFKPKVDPSKLLEIMFGPVARG